MRLQECGEAISPRSLVAMPISAKERFTLLLLPVRGRLEGYALALARGNREDARDLLADALMKTFERLDRLQDEKGFAAYVITAMRRASIRRRWRMRIFSPFTDETPVSTSRSARSTDGRYDIDLLYRALDLLPERTREVLVLFEIAGLSLNEIVEIQGGSLSGVKSRLVRGRQRLAELLGEERMGVIHVTSNQP
jgi:RNA polymerase sigma-70 factor (ECF subfamily)